MSDFALPNTRYAVSGEVNIAYQTMGAGPIDVVLVPGVVSHVEFLHEFPEYTAFLRRLSKFARVITFDKRGQGLSDRISGAPSLELRMDDLRAIMDAVGSRRVALLGVSEGSPMSALFAATYPERVSQLILYGGFARGADLWGSDSGIEIPLDQAIPVALFVNELITNSAKYGHSNSKCEVWVEVIRDDSIISVSVRDEGIGVPPNFESTSSKGLGMRLIKAFAAQLVGTLEIRRHDPGVEFVLMFPMPQQ